MEPAREVGLRMIATSAALTPSSKPLTLSDLQALPRMMATMKASRPNQEIPPETALVWMDDWRRIAEEFGVQRMERVLAALRIEQKFLPQPDEIRARCEELMANERAEFLKAHPFKACEKCDGMGMVIVERNGRFEGVDCECYREWKRSCEQAKAVESIKPSEAQINKGRVVGQ